MTSPLIPHRLRRQPPRGWSIAVGVALVVVALAALPPFVGPGVSGGLMQLFSPLCHQLPDRSFAVGGVPFALCHRCYGIAMGVLGGLLCAPLVRVDAREGRRGFLLLVLAAVPMAFDWLLGALDVVTNTPFSRVGTGAVFGVVAGTVIARALEPPRPTADPGATAPD